MVLSVRERASLAFVLLAAAKPAGHAAEVQDEWQKQAAKAIGHVSVVMENNPGKQMSEILSRPDVLQALNDPFVAAGQFTVEKVIQVWQEQDGPEDSAYRDSLTADVLRNSLTASARMQQVLYAGKGKIGMQKVAKDLARRAMLSVRVAEVRAAAERDLLAIAAKSQLKRWVSHLDGNTCSDCRELHGQVLHVLEEFPADAGGNVSRVYRDLLGPPRHPHCRCRLVPA